MDNVFIGNINGASSSEILKSEYLKNIVNEEMNRITAERNNSENNPIDIMFIGYQEATSPMEEVKDTFEKGTIEEKTRSKNYIDMFLNYKHNYKNLQTEDELYDIINNISSERDSVLFIKNVNKFTSIDKLLKAKFDAMAKSGKNLIIVSSLADY